MHKSGMTIVSEQCFKEIRTCTQTYFTAKLIKNAAIDCSLFFNFTLFS